MRMRPSGLVLAGMLAGLAAVLQLGPVWWPGGGYVLAMAATLPVAVGVALRPYRCNWFVLVSCVLIGMFAVEELFVFMMTTGPLGVLLGLTIRRPAWQSVLASALGLAWGMLLLPGLAGIYPWGGVERGWTHEFTALAYGGFALGYSSLWVLLFRRVWSRITQVLRYTRGDGS